MNPRACRRKPAGFADPINGELPAPRVAPPDPTEDSESEPGNVISLHSELKRQAEADRAARYAHIAALAKHLD